MSANGTPQSYLYQQRGQSDQYRDRSMEQSNTNSGNPSGYMPQTAPGNRYIPPSFNPQTGQWNTDGLQYSTPQGYNGYGNPSMPNPNTFMNFRGPQTVQSSQIDPVTGKPIAGYMPQQGPNAAHLGHPRTATAQLPGTQIPANQPANAQPAPAPNMINPAWIPQTAGGGGLSQGLAHYLPWMQR